MGETKSTKLKLTSQKKLTQLDWVQIEWPKKKLNLSNFKTKIF